MCRHEASVTKGLHPVPPTRPKCFHRFCSGAAFCSASAHAQVVWVAFISETQFFIACLWSFPRSCVSVVDCAAAGRHCVFVFVQVCRSLEAKVQICVCCFKRPACCSLCADDGLIKSGTCLKHFGRVSSSKRRVCFRYFKKYEEGWNVFLQDEARMG